jgi:hypothetical protein
VKETEEEEEEEEEEEKNELFGIGGKTETLKLPYMVFSGPVGAGVRRAGNMTGESACCRR